ncbi:MAG TPA: hypothetical protein VN888_04450, partial [Mycobacterium sp.]|nr:hypothetical protein [Mycobacterium sp.]
ERSYGTLSEGERKRVLAVSGWASVADATDLRVKRRWGRNRTRRNPESGELRVEVQRQAS